MSAGQTASVNGLELYYETQGKGRPLVLVHGGLGSTAMFADLAPQWATSRRVIAVDLQGHGHTPDLERPFAYEQLADDVAALVASLGQGPVDLLGYSLGGGVALQTAVRHAQAIRRLVVVSAPVRRDGWYPEVQAGQAALNAEVGAAMAGSPPQVAYAQAALHPADWPRLVAKTGELLARDYDWSEAVAALPMPCLLVFGDADAIRPAHMVEMFGLLGGGRRDAGWDGSARPVNRLAILPGTTHYDILASPQLPGLVAGFLDAQLPGGAGG